MNTERIAALLAATVSPDREQANKAEKELDSMQKIHGFPGLILQIVMNNAIDQSVRQSGAIYLKNFCSHFWMEREVVGPDGDSLSNFAIHEQDKQYVRDNIVESIIASNTLLRSQLVVIANQIIKNDYPHKFPEVNDKILSYMQKRDDPPQLMGSLLVLYQIVKCFEYKTEKEREPLIQSMKVFLPIIQDMADSLSQGENVEASLLLQKQILKVFYALIQFRMPVGGSSDLINQDNFLKWMEIIRRMLIREVPASIDEYDDADKNESAFWKNKKWCCHITHRIFERYGSPGNVDEQYTDFAKYWLETFSVPMLTNQLQLLKQKQEGKYISPRVLQLILNYVETAIGHAKTWNVIKSVYNEMLVVVLFPLLCFSDDDQDLWDDDPHEYIRSKFDVFEDFISPNTAAAQVLHTACSKRKQVLQTTVEFCMQKLNAGCGPREQDGVLHIIGSVADALMKKKPFKEQMEALVVNFILPSFENENGYIRARACWVLQHCSTIKFQQDVNLQKCGDVLRSMLLNESEQLPVRVEAAIALNQLICQQPKISDYMKNYLGEIMKAMLFLIHETENDELTDVVRKMLCFYCEDIIPFAVDMASNIVATFLKVISSDDEDTADDRAITAVGLLNTLETMLDVVEEEKAIMEQLEGIVCRAIAHVLQNRIMDYYEEVLSLLYSVTCTQISEPVWSALQLIFEVFQDDGFDFFTEMLPCLHNFLVNDTTNFLANPTHLEIIYTMCQKVLRSNAGEDPEQHAVKLLECVILQCRGKIDQILPKLLELALERLMKEIKTAELRQMCLQVVIAAIVTNPDYVLQLLNEIRFPNTNEPVGADHFVRKWLTHIEDFTGIHDRRVCIMGLNALLQCQNKPPCLNEQAIQSQVMGDFIHLFNGLQKAIQVRDEDDDDEDDDDENVESEEELNELDDTEDDVDQEEIRISCVYTDAQDYATLLKELNEGDDNWEGETGLEGYQTAIDDEEQKEYDVFIMFKNTLMALQSNNPNLYNALTASLSAEFKNELSKIIQEAEQHENNFNQQSQ